MAQIVKATCGCGASVEMRDDSGVYLAPGDPKGRVYRVELRMDEWLDRHETCRITAIGEQTPQEQKEA